MASHTAHKKLLFILLQTLLFFIYTLILASLFGFGIRYFADYSIEATGLDSAVKEVWPSAQTVGRYDLNGSKLYVFKADSVYRYMFFPKALFRGRYALNDYSILSTYQPFDETEFLRTSLTDYRGTYHVVLSAVDATVIDFDRTKNLTGLSPAIQIIIILIYYCMYFYGMVCRYKRFKENKRWLI